jgi:hypothetical protein
MTKRVNGKQKGNTFERTIANLFSERFAGATGVEQAFRRNPDSGSFFGGSNLSRTETHNLDFAVYGDLIAPRNFRFSAELKFYKSAPTFDSLLKQKITEWDGWIAQCEQDCSASGKKFLLIVKYNRTEVLAMVSAEEVTKGIPYKEYSVLPLSDLLEEPDDFFFEPQTEWHAPSDLVQISEK